MGGGVVIDKGDYKGRVMIFIFFEVLDSRSSLNFGGKFKMEVMCTAKKK